MTNANTIPMGHECNTNKAPGHWVLARLGKRVLRPGGLELTRRLLNSMRITESDDVIEFAPGLGATASITLKKHPKSYTAVERDERAVNTVRTLLNGHQYRCIVGRAEETGLPNQCATIVCGEAMLSMQTNASKSMIIGEAARLLQPGGRYGIHGLAFAPDSITQCTMDEICDEFSKAIHHNVRPLTTEGWQSILAEHGLYAIATHSTPMHLLKPHRIFADEGVAGTIRFACNLIRDSEARHRVRQMRRLFQKHQEHVMAVAIVATKH